MKRQTARGTSCWTALLAGLAVLAAVARVEAAVSVSSGSYHFVSAGNGAESDDEWTWSTLIPDIPESITIRASAGGASASTRLTRTQSAFSASFDHEGGSTGSFEGFSVSYDFFTVTAPTPYVLSGKCAMLGKGQIYYEAYLYSYDDPEYRYGYPAVALFHNSQSSISTEDEAFTLGLTEGDFGYYLEGSLTGTLFPDTAYCWYYQFYTYYDGPTNAGVSATGNVTLSFGSEVPEPASLVVWSMIGGVGLAGAWLRRRRKAA